jgi:cysteine-rich repeat protein
MLGLRFVLRTSLIALTTFAGACYTPESQLHLAEADTDAELPADTDGDDPSVAPQTEEPASPSDPTDGGGGSSGGDPGTQEPGAGTIGTSTTGDGGTSGAGGSTGGMDCTEGTLDCDCGPGDSCDAGLRCDMSLCVESFCGDGFVDVGESCDDGNDVDHDGCSSTCTSEPFCYAFQNVACPTGATQWCSAVEFFTCESPAAAGVACEACMGEPCDLYESVGNCDDTGAEPANPGACELNFTHAPGFCSSPGGVLDCNGDSAGRWC